MSIKQVQRLRSTNCWKWTWWWPYRSKHYVQFSPVRQCIFLLLRAENKRTNLQTFWQRFHSRATEYDYTVISQTCRLHTLRVGQPKFKSGQGQRYSSSPRRLDRLRSAPGLSLGQSYPMLFPRGWSGCSVNLTNRLDLAILLKTHGALPQKIR
jgi:hypothetical protein